MAQEKRNLIMDGCHKYLRNSSRHRPTATPEMTCDGDVICGRKPNMRQSFRQERIFNKHNNRLCVAYIKDE